MKSIGAHKQAPIPPLDQAQLPPLSQGVETALNLVPSQTAWFLLGVVYIIYLLVALYIHRKDRKELMERAIKDGFDAEFSYGWKGVRNIVKGSQKKRSEDLVPKDKGESPKEKEKALHYFFRNEKESFWFFLPLVTKNRASKSVTSIFAQ